MRKTKGLYKRGNVFWMTYKADGMLYRYSTGKTTQKEAEYVLACRRKEIKEGKLPEFNKGKCKFAELAKEYDTTCAKQQKGYGTKKYIIRQLVEEFGNLNVKDLDAIIVERYRSKYERTRKPATANRMLACLKHMLTKAVDWNMANEETLKRVRKVEFLKENNKRLRFLNADECKRLLGCCPKHLKPIVTTAVYTGMRRGEILSLKWEQIDLRHGYISLTDTKSGDGREVPINDTLGEMFEEMPHSIESVYVFTDENGNPYKSVKRSFNTALRKAEIYDFRFHDLRHTFASQLVMNGMDLTTVKELLGHKTLNMTLRYSHLAPEHKSKAVKVLDAVLKSYTNENFSSHSGSQFTDYSNSDSRKPLSAMVGATGFEPATS